MLAKADEVAELRDRVIQLTRERDAMWQDCTALATQIRSARALARGLREQNRLLRADMNTMLDRQVTE